MAGTRDGTGSKGRGTRRDLRA